MESRTAYSTWTPQKPTLFDGHYLRNRSTLGIVVLGYIGIVQHKEHSPEVLSFPPGTPCIYIYRSTCSDDHENPCSSPYSQQMTTDVYKASPSVYNLLVILVTGVSCHLCLDLQVTYFTYFLG